MSFMNKLTSKKLVVICSCALAAILAILIWIWTNYGYRSTRFECTNYAMGTYIQQTVYGRNAETAAAAAAKSIGDLEDLISWRIEDSDIQRLNENAGVDWIDIDPKTVSILKLALDVAEKSGGAFDPTIQPISALWDFGGDNQQVPDPALIQEFLPFVNYKDLRVDAEENSASLKLHYMAVDLGAVGKGAACTEAVSAYAEAGAEAGIISVGGSVGVFWEKADGTPWSIAVRDPKSEENKAAALGSLDLVSGYVSTSGSYEKQFTENGVFYHHLLNPKTGYPEQNGLVSVTVIASDGALSDALSTACFVLGLEKGAALLEEYDASGIFIDENNTIYVTENAKDQFHLTSSSYTLSAELL